MVSKLEDRHKTYEVDDQATRLTVHAGATMLDLLVGKETADKRGNYIRVDGDKRVFASRGRIGQALDTDAKKWREHEIIRFEKDDAKKLVLEHGEGEPVSFVKNDAGAWVFETKPDTLPPDFVLDSMKVDRIVQGMSSLNAADFDDDPGELSAIGLDPPSATVTVSVGDENKEYALGLGGSNEDDSQIYVKRPGNDQVFVVRKYNREQIFKYVSDLRDLHVAAFEPEKAKTLELTNGGEKLVFERTGNDWVVAGSSTPLPEGFVLDPKKSGRAGAGAPGVWKRRNTSESWRPERRDSHLRAAC
ncbi:MAG: DUF4340 domain-containing protein [Deltaproteobacteria bacterium]|nr:DUF4340 domain-containing protein [Deltaproteobacteria bacterium]